MFYTGLKITPKKSIRKLIEISNKQRKNSKMVSHNKNDSCSSAAGKKPIRLSAQDLFDLGVTTGVLTDLDRAFTYDYKTYTIYLKD